MLTVCLCHFQLANEEFQPLMDHEALVADAQMLIVSLCH
jgi:hypothetical protein